jgi:outer membrane protein OmpA-like peptidoglycan-associated protein
MNLVACNSDTSRSSLTIPTASSIAIIGNLRACSENPAQYLNENRVNNFFLEAGSPNSHWKLISVSGSPVMSEQHITPLSDAVTQQQVDDDQAYYSSIVKKAFIIATSNAPEADLLASLILGANWLKDEPQENAKFILVIDSGICTIGLLSFKQEGLLAADLEIDNIIEQLSDLNSIPDLEGVNVTFAGLGRTAAPQQEPDETQRKMISKLWKAVVEKGGGTFEECLAKFSSETISSIYPVSVIEFPASAGLVFTTPWVLTEAEVKFKPDETSFVDITAAKEALRPVAEVINQNPKHKILIAGTTATIGSSENCLELSKLRAESVRQLLIDEFAVDSKQLITVGLGFDHDPFDRALDLDTNGHLIEKEAAKNRRVIVLDANDKIAKQILEPSNCE